MGPLTGLKVVEMAGIGPAPFCAMLLADLGADVVRLERPDAPPLIPLKHDVLNRGKRSVGIDLKTEEGLWTARSLIDKADVLIEGFRPGVMERLGLGPEVCHATNPKLVYGRMTGWGQDGPLAPTAGHDINYLALTGALHAIGDEAPTVPLNLVADFGGGGMVLAFGLLAAVFEARQSGAGQVVDAAMVDGAAGLMAMIYGMLGNGLWLDRRRANLLDGAAPFYTVYECADGKWLAVGCIEAPFFRTFLEIAGLSDHPACQTQNDRATWPAMRAAIADRLRSRTRDEWAAAFEGTDACVSPVLSMEEAPHHPHMRARHTFTDDGGITQPAPAPRFSRTPGGIDRPPPAPGADTAEVLKEWLEGSALR